MYVARDQLGQLHFFERKPKKVVIPNNGYWSDPKGGVIYSADNRLLPKVKWEDKRATKISFKIEK